MAFYVFAGISIAAAIIVVSVRNAIHSALSLLLLFFCVAAIYLLLGAELIAGLQIFLYTGAIMVMILFALMLIDARRLREERHMHNDCPLSLVVGLLFGLAVLPTVGSFGAMLDELAVHRSAGGLDVLGMTKAIGSVLYVQHLLPFEIASALLLVAMIGVIVLPQGKGWNDSHKERRPR